MTPVPTTSAKRLAHQSSWRLRLQHGDGCHQRLIDIRTLKNRRSIYISKRSIAECSRSHLLLPDSPISWPYRRREKPSPCKWGIESTTIWFVTDSVNLTRDLPPLLLIMLAWRAEERPSAVSALEHLCFRNIHDAPNKCIQITEHGE